MIQLGLAETRGAAATARPHPEVTPPDVQRTVDALAQTLSPKFQVLQPLAIGGMATIVQLRHRGHGALFVAKVLHAHLEGRPEIRACFRREATHLARLGEHPNLIPVLDCNLDGLPCYLVLPYVQGEDLDRILAEAPLSRSEAFQLVSQMASTLSHLESHGIVHGDLSPGNIRLDTFGRYRLLDFGMSRDLRETHPLPRGGTPLYTSPEQIEGQLPTTASDLYALGHVLAEAVAQRPLIQQNSIEAIELCHKRGDWQLPESIRADARLSWLLERLLARDPNQRMQSAYELSGALAAMGVPAGIDPNTANNIGGSGRVAKAAHANPPRRGRLSPLPQADPNS